MIDPGIVRDQLPTRRWFGGRGRDVAEVEIVDEAILEDGPPALVVGLARVVFADGGDDLYHLVMLVDEDGTGRDAFDEPERLALVGELMARGETIKGSHGAFHFGGPGLDPMSPPGGESVRAVGAEQSNSSFIVDDKVIVKVFRRVAPGNNPELELARVLTTEGFDNIPPHVGEILYERQDEDEETSIDLGIAQTFIADAVEGWEDTLRHLRSLYDDAPANSLDMRAVVEERAADMLDRIEELGDVTASLHVLLGREELVSDLAPEPVDAADLSRWADSVRISLERLLAADDAPEELAALAPRIVERIEQLPSVADPGWKIRIHGDYHLGQVLTTSRGWTIIDFEGEPARSLAERRAKRSALVDVAGMLRSFSYAPLAVLFERADPASDEWALLEPVARAWEESARARFMTGYLSKSHEGRILPPDRDDLGVMLDVHEIDKALYEVEYERRHRPDWMRIPLRGIRQTIERGEDR